MPLLSVNNAAFAYQAGHPIFNDVNFQLNAGQIFTILGPNGAGKSTLLKCLLGFQELQRGQILIGGENITGMKRRQLAQQIAYVPQDYQVNTGLSVMDYLLTARAPYLSPLQLPGKEERQQVLTQLARFNLRHLLGRRFSSLSGGQQQLVTIIKALVQQPKLLILDEPMAALDLSRQRQVLTLLKELAATGMAIILTTHLPDHVFLLDSKVGLFFPGGTLRVGSTTRLMTKDNLTSIYHTPVELVYLPQLGRYTCQLVV